MTSVQEILKLPLPQTFKSGTKIPVEDYSVKKVLHILEGTVQKVPSANSDIANKLYCDSLSAGSGGFAHGTIPLGSLTLVLPQGHLPLGSMSGSVIPHGVIALGSLTLVLPQGVLPVGSIPSLTAYIPQGVIPVGSLTNSLPQGVLPAGSLINSIPQGQITSGSLPTNPAVTGNLSVAGSIVLTGDNSTADVGYVPMILYNTDATPPTASGFPIGTLYVQYTA